MENIQRFSPAKKPDYDPATIDYDHLTEEVKTAYQNVGIEKLGYVVELIQTSEVEPTLIFTWHRKVNQEYVAKLTELGYRVGQIIGGSTDKHELQTAFQAGELDFLVISISAGGTGLNLSRASRVMFAELPWTYVDYYQCMNRAHRLTTKHAVWLYTFILSGTLDEGLYDTMLSQKKMSTSVVGSRNQTIEVKGGKTTTESVSTRTITDTGAGTGITKDAVKSDSSEGTGPRTGGSRRLDNRSYKTPLYRHVSRSKTISIQRICIMSMWMCFTDT